MGFFILTWPKHSGHCGPTSNIFQTTAPVDFFHASSESPPHPDSDAQATRPPPLDRRPLISSRQQCPLMHSSAPSASSDGQGAPRALRHGLVSMVGESKKKKKKGASSSEPPPPPESLIITCEGGLVIFLIIPHFISIPPFQTQREKLIALNIHLYNLPRGP